ncbi:MAG: hypothetical protein ABH844_07440 [Candidatus Omnitrophota bacterium]
MDLKKYSQYTKEKENKFEAVCARCGQCCGALDDPCQNLAKDESGRYFCKDYKNRLGPQKTASGNFFNCVPIREHISHSTLRPACAYKLYQL